MLDLKKIIFVLLIVFLMPTISIRACFVIDGYTNEWPANALLDTDPTGDDPSDAGQDIVATIFYDEEDVHGQTNLYLAIVLRDKISDGVDDMTEVYIDADNNAGTGAPLADGPWWYSGTFGADYKLDIFTSYTLGFYNITVADGVQYWSSGHWNPGTPIFDAECYSNIIELKIPFDAMPNSGSLMAFAVSIGATNATNLINMDVNNDDGQSGIVYTRNYGICPDTSPPQLVYSDPADGEVFVTIDKDITLRLNDNGIVRSNTISVVVDGSYAVIDGVFQSDFTGTITSYNTWGWEVFINPNSDFLPNTTINVDVFAKDRDDNILNTTFSFLTAYGVIIPPAPPPLGISPLKQGQYYWGWAPDTEGGKSDQHNSTGSTTDDYLAWQAMSDFEIFILPSWETLQTGDRNFYANHMADMRNRNPNMIILAGVDVDSQSFATSSNHALSAISTFNPDGIFWENLEMRTRSYQNRCWNFDNDRGLIAACNGYGDPASIFSNSGIPSTVAPGSIFVWHDFMITNGNYYSDYSRMIEGSKKLDQYQNKLGIKVMGISMEPQNSQWGDYDTGASLNRQDFAYINALLWGNEYFSYGDQELSSISGDEYLYWYPESRMPYIGTMYLSLPQSNTSSGNWERLTDTGVIWVDYSNDTAGFSPYGIYYVDISIGNNGASPAQAQNPATPWKTIGHAISNVNAGSIIKVEPTGIYNETMTIINGGGGFWNLPITIEGDGGKPDVVGSFVFNAQLVAVKNLNITSSTSNAIHLLSTASNVIIKNCIIHDTSTYAGIRCEGHKNLIINSIISNANYGIQLSGSGSYNNYIANNTIYNCTSAGIYSENSSKSNTIAFNDIYNNYHGIYLKNSDMNGIMLNHIYDNSHNGIFARNALNTIVKNNTCVKNNNGIRLAGTDTGTTVINNITMSNTTGYNSGAGAWSVTYSCSYNDTSAVNNFNGGTFTSGTGCVTIDPVFSSVASRDLRLGINTTLLDKGTPQQIAGAIGGTGVSVIPADSTPNVVTSHSITFTTPYPNGAIPVDGKIVLVYPSGFDVSSISVSSSTIDGGFIVSIYSNQITIARDGSGTKTNPGETYSLTINNIRNTTAIGINTIYWKITDSYDQDLFGPQISNDINIGEPFTVLVTTPNNGAVGYSLTNDVKVVFSQNVKVSTVNSANFKIYDSAFQSVSGTVSLLTTNQIQFIPNNTLIPNEWYRGIVTTGIHNTNDVALYNDYIWKFKTEQGETTPHEYHTIILDGNIVDWDSANIVTYDSSNVENLATESVDDSGADQTEEFWGTWDTNKLYFYLRKDNTGGSTVNWYDYIAIDVTRDDRGADSFNSSFATYSMNFSFSNYRKPEFVIALNHVDGGRNWADINLNKWTGTKWTNLGSSHLYWQGSGVNDSEYIECGIDINILSNSAVNALDPIPNRISVFSFSHRNNTTYDYCPEIPTWLNMDIDNDGNNVPDFVIPYGGPLYVSAQDGNDQNKGTIDAPLQTINEAFNRFDANPKITNTIAYCRGVFLNQYNVTTSGGISSHPYVLDAWTNKIGKLPVLNANGNNYGFYFNCTTAKSNIEIRHWAITNFTTTGIYVRNNGGTYTNIIIAGCRLHSQSGGRAIYFNQSGSGAVVSNVIYNCPSFGNAAIEFANNAYPSEDLCRNYIYNVGNRGIRISSAINGLTIRNNTIAGIGATAGIHISSATGWHIYNNILKDITGRGIYCNNGNSDANYNCFTNISGVNTQGITNTILNNQLHDPKLLSFDPDNSNFLHINAISPCVDAGNPIYDFSPETRFTHIDIGAYENTNNAFPLLRVITSNILLSSAYGNKKIPGSRMQFVIKYDNDASAVANNSVIEVSISSNVSYVSNSASQNNNFHTGAGSVTIEVFDGSSWVLDDGNYNPNFVQKIRWIFSNPIGSDDNSEGNDTTSFADGEFPDSDAGIVRYDVVIR